MELYKISDGNEIYYYNTGNSTITITDLNEIYEPYPVNRDFLEKDILQQQLKIYLPILNPIVNKYKIFNPINLINVEIYTIYDSNNLPDTNFSDTTTSTFLTMIFKGTINTVDFNYDKSLATLNCKTFTDKFKSKLPRQYFTASCSYSLYSKECSLIKENFKYSVNLTSYSFTNNRKNFNNVDISNITNLSRYIRGIFEVNSITGGIEYSFIINVDNVNNKLILLYPITTSDANISSINIYEGCDKTLSACKLKNNIINYGGFPLIPHKNPVQGI